VSRELLGDWSFWTLVSGWISILLLTNYVGHLYGRIRRSIGLVIYVGGFCLVVFVVLVGFILRISELFWSPVVGMFAFFSMAQFYDVSQNLHRSRMLPAFSTASEDQAILSKAQELSRKLQVSDRFNPLYVTWVSNIYSDEVSFEDEFQKRNLLLPLPLRGKLSSEELLVLIAAFLVEQKTGFVKSVISYAKVFLPIIAYTVVWVEGSPVLLNIPYASLAARIGYFAILAVLMIVLFAQIKRRNLANDLRTSQLVGKESLLAVLKKIDDLKLRDMQRLSTRRDLRARLYSLFKPNLKERIDNLTRE
jgi:hypothetical protein